MASPSSPPRAGQQRASALIGLILLAATVRFGTLGAKGFWGDEISTVDLVHRPLGHMLTGIGNLESTPPLYYLVSWLWVKVFPSTEVGLRAIPAICGVALVPVAYWIGRELGSTRAATIAAALVAANPFLVWYSQEARSYSLLALLSAIALLLMLRALRRPSGHLYAGWMVVSSLALATHYFAAFLVLPEAVILLQSAPRRRAVAAAIGFVAIVGTLLLPLALQQQSHGHADWIGNAPILGRLAVTPIDFLVGFDLTAAAVPVAALVILAALVGLARLAQPRARGDLRLMAVLLAATVAIPLILSLAGFDYLDPRNLIVALVPALVLLAMGFAAPSRPRLGGFAAAGLCVASLAVIVLTAWEPKYHSEDWRAAASDLGPARVDRLVVATPGSFARKPLEFYLPASRPLPSSGDLVGEVDVLALPSQGSTQPTTSPALSTPGLHLVGRDFDGRFLVWRYRPPAPLWLTLRDLGPSVGRTRATVIWQQSGTSAQTHQRVG